jgi:hypothetical protein
MYETTTEEKERDTIEREICDFMFRNFPDSGSTTAKLSGFGASLTASFQQILHCDNKSLIMSSLFGFSFFSFTLGQLNPPTLKLTD